MPGHALGLERLAATSCSAALSLVNRDHQSQIPRVPPSFLTGAVVHWQPTVTADASSIAGECSLGPVASFGPRRFVTRSELSGQSMVNSNVLA